MNIDGCSGGNPGPRGIGCIFQNYIGHLLDGFRGYIGHTTSTIAECIALFRGVQRAHQNGYKKLIIQSGSSIILQGLVTVTMIGKHHLSTLIHICKNLCGIFSAVQLQKIYRETKNVADWLSKQGASQIIFQNINHPITHPELVSFWSQDKLGATTPKTLSYLICIFIMYYSVIPL